MHPMIIRVGNLEEFISEVIPGNGPVRLSLTEKWLKTSIPTKEAQLSLQGFNDLGELVWLMEAHAITFIRGKPDTPRDESIYRGMLDAKQLIQSHLEAQGYPVRVGSYGIPDDIKPLCGQFECVRWEQFGETLMVVPLDANEESL